MRPRDVFEAACHSALSRYKAAVADGTYQVTADNTLVDAILREWDKSMTARARAEYAQRGLPAAITSPQAAAARIRVDYGDTPDEQAARRADLDAYAVRRRA